MLMLEAAFFHAASVHTASLTEVAACSSLRGVVQLFCRLANHSLEWDGATIDIQTQRLAFWCSALVLWNRRLPCLGNEVRVFDGPVLATHFKIMEDFDPATLFLCFHQIEAPH